jgi:hypothetical protein
MFWATTKPVEEATTDFGVSAPVIRVTGLNRRPELGCWGGPVGADTWVSGGDDGVFDGEPARDGEPACAGALAPTNPAAFAAGS